VWIGGVVSGFGERGTARLAQILARARGRGPTARRADCPFDGWVLLRSVLDVHEPDTPPDPLTDSFHGVEHTGVIRRSSICHARAQVALQRLTLGRLPRALGLRGALMVAPLRTLTSLS
jgi:hypothetical protein